MRCELCETEQLSCPFYHVAHGMLYVMSARCVARDLHLISSWIEAPWGECKTSRIAPFNAIKIIIIYRSRGGHHITRPRRQCQALCWLVGCFTSQQHACVSQGRICSDKCTCCHTQTEVADQTFYLTQSHRADQSSADPTTPGAWQGSHWSANS